MRSLMYFALVCLGCSSGGGGAPADSSAGSGGDDVPSASDIVAGPEVEDIVAGSEVEDEKDIQVVDDDLGPPPDTALPPDAASDVTDPPVGDHKVTIGGWTMTPGQETTRCVQKRLGNTETLLVSEIRSKLSKGSHHLIVYKLDGGEEKPEPYGCSPFVGAIGDQSYPLMISEVPDETLTLPPGVAFELEPNQLIRIEAHYLNYYPEDITTEAEVTFVASPASEIEHTAGLLFYGTTNFYVPAGQDAQTDWKWYDVFNGAHIFAMTGHTHRYGTNVEVTLSPNASTPGTSLYPGEVPFQWDEAPIERYEPPLEIEAGQGLRFRCSWTNTGSSGVGFGPSAEQEMCFLWAYYYPSKGFIACADGLLGLACSDDN